MMRWAAYAILVAAFGAAAWGVYGLVQPDADDVRLTHLRGLQIPAAGAARFAFLKKEIPDIVSQVTCSCCAKKLIQCYEGACPVSCGPCNEQGKITYNMHAHGRSVADIQKYMAKNHPVHAGAGRM